MIIDWGGLKLKFRDLKAQYNKYKDEIDSAIQDVLVMRIL